MAKYLDATGLTYFWAKIKTWVGNYVKLANGKITIGGNEITPITDISGKQDVIDASHKLSADLIADGTTNKAYTATEKTKLSGIAAGAEVNQNAFSNVKVGSTTIAAGGKTDTLELGAGSNTSVYVSNGKVVIGSDDAFRTLQFADGTEITPRSLRSQVLTFLTGIIGWKTGSSTGMILKTNGDTPQEVTSITDPSKAVDMWQHGGSSQTSLVTHGGLDLILRYFAQLASPTFTGTPAAPTAAAGTNTTQIATTAFVTSAVAAGASSITDQKGAANGFCPLDANTKIDAQYLPSYVDDVIEAYARSGQTALTQNWLATGSASGTVIAPEGGKIYVLMADSGDYAANTQFRWGGTAYVKLADGGVSAFTNAEIDSITAN